jgi:hypothetical protein
VCARGPLTTGRTSYCRGVPVVSGELLDGEEPLEGDVELLESVRSPEVELEGELEFELELPWSRLWYSLLSRYPSPFLSACLKPRPSALSDDASVREIRPSPSVSIDRKVPPMLLELDCDWDDEDWLEGLWLEELCELEPCEPEPCEPELVGLLGCDGVEVLCAIATVAIGSIATSAGVTNVLGNFMVSPWSREG